MEDHRMFLIEWLNLNFNNEDFVRMSQRERMIHVDQVATELVKFEEDRELKRATVIELH